jgi:prevent-host-death family protein
MKTVSVTQLKAELAKYLRVVRRGGEVQVCDRGVPIARIAPIAHATRGGADDERIDRLVRAGVLTAPERTGEARWLLDEPPPRLARADVSAALQDDRRDRL